MFKYIKYVKHIISKIVNFAIKLTVPPASEEEMANIAIIHMDDITITDMTTNEATNPATTMDTPTTDDNENMHCIEPPRKKERKKKIKKILIKKFTDVFLQPTANPLTLADLIFKYNPHENDIIEKWNMSPKNDIRQLIVIIRQLCFFSEGNKRCVKFYELTRNDIPKLVEKVRRRPHLMIKTNDIDVHNHVSMEFMYRRMRTIIGLFRINHFMIRVEHTFDNSQIQAEYFVVKQLMKYDHYDGTNCIDSENHIVLPVCVQLNNISKIPIPERTIFHHISYSIQPVVLNSKTIDVWFREVIDRDRSQVDRMILILCAQMAKALTHLHAHEIVHGDIKPGNTLVCDPYDSNDWASASGSELENSSDDDGDGSDGGSDDDHAHSPVSNCCCDCDDHCLYLIDYGMSGEHDDSEGTGGTKPFCAPETGNGYNKIIDMDNYHWTKNKKENDMWSLGVMFFTMLTLRKCICHPKDYPADFFEEPGTGYINPECFNAITHAPMRSLFQRTLCPMQERLTAVDFLREINEIIETL